MVFRPQLSVIIEQMASDPAAAAKYEKYIAEMPESAKIMKDGIEAHGNEMVACGTAIDKNGKVTYWSISRHKPSKESQTVSCKKTLQEQLEEKRAKKKEEEALKEKRLEKAETGGESCKTGFFFLCQHVILCFPGATFCVLPLYQTEDPYKVKKIPLDRKTHKCVQLSKISCDLRQHFRLQQEKNRRN